MIKRAMMSVGLVLLLSCPVLLQAGAVKEGLSSASDQVGKGLEPVGEDVDYLGRSAFYGLGAIAIAPFRFVQDVINAISQGTSNEKLLDHTN